MGKTCDVGKCEKQAIGEFRETQNARGFTTTGTIPISETKFCAEHEEMVCGSNGDTVYYPVDI